MPPSNRRTASARSASVSGSLSSMATASAKGSPTGPASDASAASESLSVGLRVQPSVQPFGAAVVTSCDFACCNPVASAWGAEGRRFESCRPDCKQRDRQSLRSSPAYSFAVPYRSLRLISSSPMGCPMSAWPNLLASLSQWENENVDALVRERIAEDPNLDYKQSPWERNDKGKREFLKDVTAMANASGGLLVVGVKENGNGVPVERVHVEDAQAELERMGQIVNACIKHRIPGLDFTVVGEQPVAILIHVPQSLSAPHAYEFNGRLYFHKRHGRENLPMSIDEIHASVIESVRHEAQVEEFVVRRVDDIVTEFGAYAKPFIVVTATPIPLRSGSLDVLDESTKSTLRAAGFHQVVPPSSFDPFTLIDGEHVIHADRIRPFIYGVQFREREGYRRIGRLFRSGHLECGRSLEEFRPQWQEHPDSSDTSGKVRVVRREALADTVAASAYVARDILKTIGQVTAVAFSLVLTSFENCTVEDARPADFWKERSLKLAPPDIQLVFTASELDSDWRGPARQICDQLWQCFHRDRCEVAHGPRYSAVCDAPE